MPVEIERKFLVLDQSYQINATRSLFRQGYLSLDPARTLRIRLAEQRGFLTIKGSASGLTRPEYEYEIPACEATELLEKLCLKPLIEKYRYRLAYQGFFWEIDEFFGENQGLVVAEIEIEKEDTPFTKPPWLGEEVTHDPKYFNSNLIKNPYCNWR